MKKLIIGFATTDLPLSKIIRFIQGLDVSHCFIQWDDERYQETLVYEAKGLDTHIINRASFADERVVYEYEVEVEQDLYDVIMKDIHHDLGTPYGWKELIGYALKWTLSLVGIKIHNPFPTKSLICSEAVGQIIVKYLGVEADVNSGDMDIKWLLEKLIANQKFKLIVR